MVQSQTLENLAFHDASQHGDAQQPIQSLRWYLCKHPLLKFEPQTRHRDEGGGACALQVLQKTFQRFRKKHMDLPVDQGCKLKPTAFVDMCQWKVRQHPDFRLRPKLQPHVFHHALAGPRDSAKAVHHAFWLPGRPGCVAEQRHVVASALHEPGEGWRTSRDGIPGFEAGAWRKRERDARQFLRNACSLLFPGVELAHEQQACTAVFEHVAQGAFSLRWKDRHGAAPCHPDGEFGHEEMGAVFGQDGNACTVLKTLRLEMRGHATRLIQYLAPVVVNALAAADGLAEIHAIGLRRLVFVDVVQNQFALRHVLLS